MSQREITRRYNQLMKAVQTKDFYKIDLTNRVNCYVCQKCRCITKTKDVDPGVTPFIHRCEHCNSEAHSTMYCDIAPAIKPTQEWYRPTLEQVLKIKNPMLLDHILQGGLDVRVIKA